MPTLNLQVSSGSDDAHTSDNGIFSSIAATYIQFGRYSSTVDCVSGFRFNNVTVPAGSTIVSAYLVLTQNVNNSNTPLINIYCDDVDNSVTFSVLGPNRTIDRTRTTNYVVWQINDIWYSGTEYTSPNIGNGSNSPVGEVLGRPGWTSGNSLSVICDGKNTGYYYKNPYSYNGSTTKCAKLVITYTLGSDLIKNINDTLSLADTLKSSIKSVFDTVSLVDSIEFTAEKNITDTLVSSGYVVSGAGSTAFNGIYVENGTYGGKTAYEKVGGGAWIFWSSTIGLWFIQVAKQEFQPAYAGTGTILPATPWSVGFNGSSPAPTVVANSGLNDSLSMSVNHTVADTLSLADSLAKTINKTLTDTVSVEDDKTLELTSGGVLLFIKPVDNITVTDDAIYKEVGKNTDDEAVGVSDELSIEPGKNINDTLSLSDSLSFQFYKNIDESLSVSDTFSRTVEFYRTIADTVSLNDILNPVSENVIIYETIKAEIKRGDKIIAVGITRDKKASGCKTRSTATVKGKGLRVDGSGGKQLYDSGLLYDSGVYYDRWKENSVQGDVASIKKGEI